MATNRLLNIAQQVGLEAWWYPLWTNQLLVYAVGYVNPNLSIGPQATLKNPFTANNRPYVYPDFVIIDTRQAPPAPATKTVRLVMEVRRTWTAGRMIQAQQKAEMYLNYVMNGVNTPGDHIFVVAIAGNRWTWMQATNVLGLAPGPPAYTGWSPIFNQGTPFDAIMGL